MDTHAASSLAPPSVPLTTRRDVRLVTRGDHLYVCASTGMLRLPPPPAGPREDRDGNLLLDVLPERVVQGLRARGLVHQGGEREAHPLYAAGGDGSEDHVVAVADGALGEAVAAQLRRAGVRTASVEPPRVGAQAPAVAVLPLSLPEPVLQRWTEVSMDSGVPLVVHLNTPRRLLSATLTPPHTPCPVCLVRRIRANHVWQAVADLPLDVLLGAADSDAWPTTAIASGLLAHETLRLLGGRPGPGRGVLTEFDHQELERTRHALFHTPGCPGCSSRARSPRRDETGDTDVGACWERMRGAVDPLTGLVLELRVDDGAGEEGDTTYARTAGRTTTSWFSPVDAEARGGAVKSDPVTARVCAVGETMERYAAGVYGRDQLVRASFTDLGDEAVDPRDLPLGSAKEYADHPRYGPFEPDTAIDWVRGRSLTTGRARYVPACAVYLPYRFPKNHRAWFDPISTGLAAGSCHEHAVLAGLMEVVERDASVVFWENRLTLPSLDLTNLPDGVPRRIVDKLTAAGVAVTGKDLTTDLGIPAFAIRCQEDTERRPVTVHAARADLDPHAALLGALEEACLGRAGAATWQKELDAGARIPAADAALDTLRDFSLYYWDHDRARHLEFWHDGPSRPVPPPRPSQGFQTDVDEAVRRLAARGYEAISVDITPIDVAECGVSVVRSLVPGLCPITLRSDFHRRGGPRVFHAPVAMGVRTTPLGEDDLNPLPLPFL
ncbi:TOMM precursor leader peptide-binding protein [Streptomyces sp. NPDC094034]|uniref:TOMM precursor leader peptide-binding protein n=1 Tax=Streptomyces sp. NPDC094034 TaxID=3155309 RepID=UPI0033215F2B